MRLTFSLLAILIAITVALSLMGCPIAPATDTWQCTAALSPYYLEPGHMRLVPCGHPTSH